MFDPAEKINELLVILVVAVLLLFAIRYKENLMLAITGDTHVHVGVLDGLWICCFRCCGLCTGEWTRCLVCCSCCPNRLRNKNLVKLIGQTTGFSSCSVQIKNIVVGDLPYSGRVGNFFITVECARNPDMVTSVAEEVEPKVVHFPETLTMKMRNNYLESRVYIRVREVNPVGFDDICDLHLSAISMLDWAQNPKQSKRRFQMKPIDTEFVLATPPWIYMELDLEPDERDLEKLAPGSSVVRTYNNQTGVWKDTVMPDFKNRYTLVDNGGKMVDETPEEDMAQISRYRSRVLCLFSICQFLVWIVIVAFSIFRVYLWSCYDQFRKITQAALLNDTLPMSTFELNNVSKYCRHKMRGTGVQDGMDSCRPSGQQIQEHCQPDFLNMHDQPRPTAFVNFINRMFSLDIEGVPCKQNICKIRNAVVSEEMYIYISLAVLIVLLCCCHTYANHLIRAKKSKLASLHAKESNEMKKTLKENKR